MYYLYAMWNRHLYSNSFATRSHYLDKVWKLFWFCKNAKRWTFKHAYWTFSIVQLVIATNKIYDFLNTLKICQKQISKFYWMVSINFIRGKWKAGREARAPVLTEHVRKSVSRAVIMQMKRVASRWSRMHYVFILWWKTDVTKKSVTWLPYLVRLCLVSSWQGR